jgi:hypothetical protein
MSGELVPTGPQTDVVGTAHMVDGELIVRMRPSGAQDVTAQPVHRGDPDTLAGSGFMRYVGPLTGAERTEYYAALARRERRRQRWRRWLRWGTRRQEVAR